MLESGLHNNHSVSYKDETDRSGKFHVQVNVENTQTNTSEHGINSSQHSQGGEPQQMHAGKRKSRSIEDYPLPALPPKPKVLEKSDTHKEDDKCDYDHLKPVSEEDTTEDQNQYAELEEPIERSMSDPPPQRPPRHTGPHQHYYHTLEGSEESGILRSTTTSQGGSQQSGMNEYDTPGGIELPPGASISNQLKELFDDPRYAVLCLNQDHLEHVHVNKKTEVSRSRSTPSLVAVDIIPLSPSATERRSLRAVHHKRLSVLSSHLFSGQY